MNTGHYGRGDPFRESVVAILGLSEQGNFFPKGGEDNLAHVVPLGIKKPCISRQGRELCIRT